MDLSNVLFGLISVIFKMLILKTILIDSFCIINHSWNNQ